MMINATVTDTSGGPNTGGVSVTVTNGIPPYQYYWSNGSTSSYDYGLSVGTYYLVVTDHIGCREVDSFYVGTPSGIAGISGETNINISPNPNNGSFILQSSDAVGKEYIITDMLGRVVSQQAITSNRQNISLQNISAGSYMLSVKGINKGVRFTIE